MDYTFVKKAIEPYRINKEDLVFGEVLGKGAFGYVTEGLWKETGEICAIKSIFVPESSRESGEQNEYSDFLNETHVMVKVRHFNVLNCMGWSSDSSNVYLLTEFMPFALDRLLQSTTPEYAYKPAESQKPKPQNKIVNTQATPSYQHRRLSVHEPPKETDEQKKKREAEERRTALKKKLQLAKRPILSNQMKLQIAIDVAEGMNYLHTRNVPVVHRDLKVFINVKINTFHRVIMCF
jgi:serine/threonine protein kinase